MSALTVGSLFSGIGGIDLGLERAGFRIVWQCEIDAYCQKVLRKHWPDVARYGDIRTVGKHNLAAVDLLAGGFPCQPHSLAGERKGSEDERDLWGEFYRLICEIRPSWVLAENVPGLLSSDDGRFFGGILRDLAQARYDAQWRVLSAAQFGAPHLRERVFLVAYPISAAPWMEEHRSSGQGRQPTNTSQSTLVRQEYRQVGTKGIDASSDASHANLQRFQRFWTQKIQRVEAFSWCKDIRSLEDLRNRPDLPPSLIRGNRHGIPDVVDRLKSLGNAVVPQVAEYVGRCILESRNEQEQTS